jgi:hypothetical protein
LPILEQFLREAAHQPICFFWQTNDIFWQTDEQLLAGWKKWIKLAA